MTKQMAKICFAMPCCGIDGYLQDAFLGSRARSAGPLCLICCAEAALTQKSLDPILPAPNRVLHKLSGAKPKRRRTRRGHSPGYFCRSGHPRFYSVIRHNIVDQGPCHMKRAIISTFLAAFAGVLAFGQSAE